MKTDFLYFFSALQSDLVLRTSVCKHKLQVPLICAANNWMFTTSIFGEYQQVLIRSDFKGLGFCPISLDSGFFLFVFSSSFISVCLPLVLEGDISNLAGFTRCMGAINLVGGCCQVRLPTSATCWLWYSSSTYSCQYSRGFVIITTRPQPAFGLRVNCWASIQFRWVNLGIHFAPLALSSEATWQINGQMHQSRSYDFSY